MSEKTKRRVRTSMAPPRAQVPQTNMQVHGLVVPSPSRKPSRRTKRASSRLPAKLNGDEQRLFKRVANLAAVSSLKRTQVAAIVGLSYSGFYRATVSKDLKLSAAKVRACHARIDEWRRQIAAV